MATPGDAARGHPRRGGKRRRRGGYGAGGIIPLSDTIFLWQTLARVVDRDCRRRRPHLVHRADRVADPDGRGPRASASNSVSGQRSAVERDAGSTPGEWLEHQWWLNAVRGAAGGHVPRASPCGTRRASRAPSRSTGSTSSSSRSGSLLHRTPARLMRAFRDAAPPTWGVILQFPFYGGIAAIITETHLNAKIAGVFTAVATKATFPAADRRLLRGARRVRAVGRVEVGDRGAVRDAGRARPAGAPGLDGRGLRPGRGAGQPGAAVLDAAGAGAARAQGARRDGLHVPGLLVLAPVVLVLVTVLGATLAYPL